MKSLFRYSMASIVFILDLAILFSILSIASDYIVKIFDKFPSLELPVLATYFILIGFTAVFLATRLIPFPSRSLVSWIFTFLSGGLYLCLWLWVLFKQGPISAPPLFPFLPCLLIGGTICSFCFINKAEQGAAANP